MKKFIFVALLSVISFSVFSQRGTVKSITVDTVKSNETIYLQTETFGSSWNYLTIQALCTQVGGTTDGTMTLQGSVDGTSWVPLTDQSELVKGYPDDSLTMTNGAVQSWILEGSPFYKYRIKVDGTDSDTTEITAKYIFK